MLPYGSTPLTYEEWKRIKSATRWRQHLARLAMLDEAGMDEWELALRRDSASDPHDDERPAPAVDAVTHQP